MKIQPLNENVNKDLGDLSTALSAITNASDKIQSLSIAIRKVDGIPDEDKDAFSKRIMEVCGGLTDTYDKLLEVARSIEEDCSETGLRFR